MAGIMSTRKEFGRQDKLFRVICKKVQLNKFSWRNVTFFMEHGITASSLWMDFNDFLTFIQYISCYILIYIEKSQQKA